MLSDKSRIIVLLRLVEGVELLAHLLHPKRVPAPEGIAATLKLRLSGAQRCRQRLLPNYFGPCS